jgi:iron complex outermembrane receptor protein
MFKKNFLLIFLFLIFFTSGIFIFAQDNGLSEMSLEELLNETVYTTGKRSETIFESPAVISIITCDELEEWSVSNLYEAISYLPGIEIMETYYGYTDIQFRGMLQMHYNNKVALLLNGHHLYDQVVSCYYLEQIPISSIQKIEVIRGPGGILYGTNAYAGVINIITKKGIDMKATKVSLKTGTFETRNIKFSSGDQIDEWDIFCASEYNESKGYYKEVPFDEDDTTLSTNYGNSNGSRQLGYYSDDKDAYENDYFNFFSSIGYKYFVINAVYFINEKDKFGLVPTLCSTGERKLQGFGANLEFNTALIKNNLDINSIVWYDQIEKNERVNAYPPVIRAPNHPDDQYCNGSKFGGQIELNYTPSEIIRVIGGGGYENSSSDKYQFFYTDSLNTWDVSAGNWATKKGTFDYWGYILGNIQFIKKINITSGIRYNKNQQAGHALLYNIGLVFLPTNKLSLKTIYNSGFRNPSLFEKYVYTVNVLVGDEKLSPEKINDLDIGIEYNFSNFKFRVNGFYIWTNNIIGRKTLDSLDIDSLNNTRPIEVTDVWTKGAMYENKEGQTYGGVEMEIEANPISMLKFFINASYKQGKDINNNNLLYFAPTLINAGFTIKPVKFLSFWEAGDYTLKGYTLLNLNMKFEFIKGLSISLIGNNLLDTEYFYPEYIRHSIPYIPGGPGRAIFAEMTYNL